MEIKTNEEDFLSLGIWESNSEKKEPLVKTLKHTGQNPSSCYNTEIVEKLEIFRTTTLDEEGYCSSSYMNTMNSHMCILLQKILIENPKSTCALV